MAYEIKNGEIIRPVIVPTICGRSLSFLNRITAISDETKIYDSIKNGCGKSGQNNLPAPGRCQAVYFYFHIRTALCFC